MSAREAVSLRVVEDGAEGKEKKPDALGWTPAGRPRGGSEVGSEEEKSLWTGESELRPTISPGGAKDGATEQAWPAALAGRGVDAAGR